MAEGSGDGSGEGSGDGSGDGSGGGIGKGFGKGFGKMGTGKKMSPTRSNTPYWQRFRPPFNGVNKTYV